jgi:hypothetical protein
MNEVIEQLKAASAELAKEYNAETCVYLMADSTDLRTRHCYYVRIGDVCGGSSVAETDDTLESAVAKIKAKLADKAAADQRRLAEIRIDAERLGYVLKPKVQVEDAEASLEAATV